MSQSSQLEAAVNKLLDFTEFFLSLGDMKQADMLFSIANRDPEFADYVETVQIPIETAVDFFKVYGDWGIEKIRKENSSIWNDTRKGYVSSEKYQILKMQCADTTVLWEVLEKIING
jgi:hypothetical protein